MTLIPFGEVEKERYEISVRYKLIEKVGGIWRLTAKCKNAYDPTSYVYYLQGKVEKPKRIYKSIKEELESPEYQNTLNDILSL